MAATLPLMKILFTAIAKNVSMTLRVSAAMLATDTAVQIRHS